MQHGYHKLQTNKIVEDTFYFAKEESFITAEKEILQSSSVGVKGGVTYFGLHVKCIILMY